jgi:precorrin-2 methylase
MRASAGAAEGEQAGAQADVLSLPPAPPAGEPPPAGELYLMGSGMKAMCHLTREAAVHLQAADVVFAGLDGTGPDRRWLELALGRTVIDLNQFYPTDPDEDRRSCYVRAAEAVLGEVRRGRRVACAVYGHPTMVDAGSELLVRSCRHEGLEVHVLPGIR